MDSIYDDGLWAEASFDHEAAHHAEVMGAASVEAAPIWAFLAGAESEEDFHNRLALSTEGIQNVASVVAGQGTPDHTLIVTALPEQMFANWSTHFAARQAATQKDNDRRGFERNAAREATKTAGVNLGNPSGSVGTGDEVIAGQSTATVTKVVIHPPGSHPPEAPIVDTMYCVEVQTSSGSTRWLGAESAEIGSDLRVHWSREDTRGYQSHRDADTGTEIFQSRHVDASTKTAALDALDEAILEHAKSADGTIKPGDVIDGWTVTDVNTSQVQVEKDGWSGSRGIPFLDERSQSYPSHQRALDAHAAKTAYTVDGYEIKAPGKDWVKLDTDDISEVEAAVKGMSDKSQPTTIVHVKNLFNDSVTVYTVSGWGGGSIESVQSYEQFYGHPLNASKKTATEYDLCETCDHERRSHEGSECSDCRGDYDDGFLEDSSSICTDFRDYAEGEREVAASKTAAADPPNIAAARRVLESKGAEDIDGVMLDMQSANAIVQVYDALSPENAAKFGAMDIAQMGTIAWKLVASKTAADDTKWCRRCGSVEATTKSGMCGFCDNATNGVWSGPDSTGKTGAQKTAFDDNSFPPKQDSDKTGADPTAPPAAPGAPQEPVQSPADQAQPGPGAAVETVVPGAVLLDAADGIVSTYEVSNAVDQGDAMLLDVTKNGGEQMQLLVPKTEPVQIYPAKGDATPPPAADGAPAPAPGEAPADPAAAPADPAAPAEEPKDDSAPPAEGEEKKPDDEDEDGKEKNPFAKKSTVGVSA